MPGSTSRVVVQRLAACLVTLLSLGGCREGDASVDATSEVGRSSLPLTGSAAEGLPSITLRNALVTQPFAPDLLTPDGRLGLVFEGTRVRFIALGDPSVDVVSGVPRFTAGMAQGEGLRINLPGTAARSTDVSRSDGTTWLLASASVTPRFQSGQGALVMDARYSPSGKPFPTGHPADCLNATVATRDASVSLSGRYDCYRLLHFQPFTATVNGDGTVAVPVYQAELVVVVDARRPDTATGGVARLPAPDIAWGQYLSSFQLSRSPSPSSFYTWGQELSATADGRLLVSEGGRWAYNETPWNPATWTRQRELGALYETVQQDLDGVKNVCRHLVSGAPSCTAAQEEPFARVYPLAAHPFYLADGTRRLDGGQPTHLRCGYTWVTPDGTDVFCRPNPALNASVQPAVALELPNGFERSTGMHTFAVGQHTAWMFQRLDSPINSRRFNPEWAVSPPHPSEPVHRALSPLLLNTATGFWAENRTGAAQALPLDRRWPVFQFMSQDDGLRTASGPAYAALGLLPESNNGGMWTNKHYWEASFACAVNPSCLLHLPMNELFYDPASSLLVPRALRRTPDVSGNAHFADSQGGAMPYVYPYVGEFVGAVRFLGEVHGVSADERYLSGFRGTGLSVGATGAVSVRVDGFDTPFCARNKGCLTGQDLSASGFTAELAFLPLFDVSTADLVIARHHGLWRLWLQAGGLYATVEYTVAGAPRTSTLGPIVISQSSSLTETPATQASKWVHVALRVDPMTRRYTLWANGALFAQGQFEAGATFQGTAVEGEALRVGPGGGCVGCPAEDAFFMDELVFHATARPDDELAAAAARYGGRTDLLTTAQARTLLARYFSLANPRGLQLQADGFPRHLRAEDLRIPSVFGAFLAQGREVAFAQLVDLGRFLFQSPGLALHAPGEIRKQWGSEVPLACATCHRLDRFFTDGLITGMGAGPEPLLNVPTLVNRALATQHGASRRSASLLDAVVEAIEDPGQSRASVEQALAYINGSPDLRSQFEGIFAESPVSRERLQQALAAFLLVQLQVESLADAVAVAGKPVVDLQGNLLRAEQVRLGKELFQGKARCIGCHSGPNFTDELAHDTGADDTIGLRPAAYKTPTLWNVADTGPYFHTGRAATLRDVLDFYNRGGHAHLGAPGGLRPVDPQLRPLALDEAELVALEVYLRALRDAGPVLAANFEGLAFSDHGPIPGMVCTAITEGSDSQGWDDNYLCAPQDQGFVWSNAGTVPGMRCTQVHESDEPASNGWGNNHLCVPESSPLQLSWSSAGPVFNKACVRFQEPIESHSWWDNFLCHDAPLKVRFSAAGPIAGMTCTQMLETADVAGGWLDNYVCTNKEIGLRWYSATPPASAGRCTQIREPAEPPSTTWNDNYLCVPPESPVVLSWYHDGSRSGAGLTCTAFLEPQDPHTWTDNYLCY